MGAFVARLCLGLLATLVATNCFEGCIGDPLGGIDDIGRIAKVEHELLRVGEVAFDLTFSPFIDPAGMLGFLLLTSPERVGFLDGKEGFQ